MLILCVNHSVYINFFFSSRRRHTRSKRDWSSDVCSSDLGFKSLQSETELHLAPLGNTHGLPTRRETSLPDALRKIGRASCRERVEVSVVAVALYRKHV